MSRKLTQSCARPPGPIRNIAICFGPPGPLIKVHNGLSKLALSPPLDWRKVLLPRGQTYESFMADLVSKHLKEARRNLLVYCGMHHAFTRYYQAELDKDAKARAYMDRMGNILSRRSRRTGVSHNAT